MSIQQRFNELTLNLLVLSFSYSLDRKFALVYPVDVHNSIEKGGKAAESSNLIFEVPAAQFL